MIKHISGFARQMRQLEGLSDITVGSYCAKVKDFLQWLAKNHPADKGEGGGARDEGLRAITRQDVEAYLEHCFFIGNKNQTRLTKLIALRKFFRYLVYESIIPEDITATILRLKVKKGRVQRFTQAEILKLFSVMPAHTEKGLRDIVILILGAFCGLRISEIIKLSISDIIDNGQSVDIGVVKTKFSANRVVYLWKAPSMFIMQWFTVRLSQGAGKDSPFLVAYKKGDNLSKAQQRLTAAGIDKILKRYASLADIKKAVVTMHMLRGTHATDLRYIRGYDLFAIKERMGWKATSTAEIYITSRERIHKEYPSLASYWRDFNHVWSVKEEA